MHTTLPRIWRQAFPICLKTRPRLTRFRGAGCAFLGAIQVSILMIISMSTLNVVAGW